MTTPSPSFRQESETLAESLDPIAFAVGRSEALSGVNGTGSGAFDWRRRDAREAAQRLITESVTK